MNTLEILKGNEYICVITLSIIYIIKLAVSTRYNCCMTIISLTVQCTL